MKRLIWIMVVIVLILGMVKCNSPTVEPQPGFNPDPDNIRSSTANNGMVVATQSSEAVEAGVAALKAGGSAADAALVTALAQVPLLPGNFITYAGILHMLYYEAETGRVYSINASWDIPRDELEPLSIPRINLQSIDPSNHSGRSALVPGFMAGVGAIHDTGGGKRFRSFVHWLSKNDQHLKERLRLIRSRISVNQGSSRLRKPVKQ